MRFGDEGKVGEKRKRDKEKEKKEERDIGTTRMSIVIGLPGDGRSA